MSQSRSRKPPAMNDDCSRTRASVPKAAGDSISPQEQHHKSKSRSKIPKSMRYDLENALVGLCNVWFQDIKPHLLRNNIKVHVHDEVPFAGAQSNCQPEWQPLRSPACSHIDPGAASDSRLRQAASFVDCCSTRRTASSAPCRKRRVSLCPVLPPLPSAPTSPRIIQNPNNDGKAETPYRRARRKTRSRPRPPPDYSSISPHSHGQMSHLCRMRSGPCPTPLATPRNMRHTRMTSAHKSSLGNTTSKFQLMVPKQKSDTRWKLKMRHKATQTELSLVHRQWSGAHRSSPPPVRRSATSFFPRRYTARHSPDGTKLFGDDLIDIISEKHNKIRESKQTSRKEDCSSIMNLYQSPNGQRKTLIKAPPWK